MQLPAPHDIHNPRTNLTQLATTGLATPTAATATYTAPTHQLRRFKDGAIQETLVWSEADSAAGPMAVPAAMASFALQRHLGQAVKVQGAASWAGKALFKNAGGAFGVEPEPKRNINGELTTVGDGVADAARAFDALGKSLMALGYDDGEA